jgi:hypothetical protein
MSRVSEPAAKPQYRYSLRLFAPVLRVLSGRPSSISRDAALLLRGAHPTPRVLNTENIPDSSPFLLLINHYDRPGLGAWWGAATIATTVAARRTHEPRDIRMVMAREWWYPGGFGKLVKQPLTRWAFRQIAQAYGILTLPPVIEEYRGQGGLDVRRALAVTRGNHPALVCISPEGRTGPNLSLCRPPNGAGLFLLMLTHDTIPCLAAGIFEDETKTLNVNFGVPFKLDVPRCLPKEERDRQTAKQAMVEIGKLLPERMWGAYQDDIRSTIPPA